jgi:hypothetical protein
VWEGGPGSPSSRLTRELVRLDDPVHEPHREDDLVEDGHTASHQAGVSALGADGEPPSIAVPEYRRDLLGAPRPQYQSTRSCGQIDTRWSSYGLVRLASPPPPHTRGNVVLPTDDRRPTTDDRRPTNDERRTTNDERGAFSRERERERETTLLG